MANKEKLAHPLKVEKIIQETPDTKSLVFTIPPELGEDYRYEAGQFTSLFMNVGGEEIVRSYSLCTAPETDSEFKITIKKVPHGRGSTYLVDEVQVGDEIWCGKPKGHFFKKHPDGTHLILVAAGSGVTPLMSILKHTLATTAKSTVSLVFSCRDQNQIIFKDELSKWQESFPERFRLIQVLTRPLPGWSGLSGRLNAEALDALFGPQENGPSVSRQAYVCGPTEFMNMVKESLESIGMDKKSIHSESFGSSHPHQASAGQAGEGPQADGSVIVGDPMADAGEKPEVIEAYFDGERVEVPAKENMSILDTLLEAGHNPPYSCMSGACTACMAKVEEGRVRQREPGSLSPENFSAREILTCQSEPMSKRVKVRFTSGD